MKCFRWGRHKFDQTLCAAFPGQVRKLWAWLIKLFIFGWFWLVLFCFSSIETPKLAVLVKKRNNRNKHLVSDSAETSFGSSFVFFEAKLVSLDTLVALLGQQTFLNFCFLFKECLYKFCLKNKWFSSNFDFFVRTYISYSLK